MALITWNDSLSVNIESIDEQHKVLVDMINDFYTHIVDKSNKELIAELIAKMKDYTVFHFAYEEKFFDQFGFPGSAKHREEHQIFIDKVEDLENRYNKGQIVLSLEVTNFLKNWLTNHIQGTDMEYSKFLVERGVR
ncbi:MAG: bacteriohemerythrin [Bacteroidota bacterium]